MVNATSTLVDEELEGRVKCWGSMAATNGCIYGIPCGAHGVVKFTPFHKSITYIGPDFGGGLKWIRGAMTCSGVIYWVPRCGLRGILKINTNTDTVTELDRNLLPEQGVDMWESCATALDRCIYCMPPSAHHIMKIDPNNNDTMSSVGDDLGSGECKYSGMVVGIDGCVYDMPEWFATDLIIKYDPITDATSFVGQEGSKLFECGGGALGRDGCIYAITDDGEVLKIDTTKNSHCFVGNSIESDYDQHYQGWGDASLGIDGCIYWPPYYARHMLKYDPHANQTSLVGDDFGDTAYKWCGGCLASDGVIDCIPRVAERILAIDPWKEYTSSLKNTMVQHPEHLGCIFHPSDEMPNETNFDDAATKFGYAKVLKAFEAFTYMYPADEVGVISDLYPFMIAASYRNSDLSMIFILLRLASLPQLSALSCELRQPHSYRNENSTFKILK